jgi:8-oxo-dGTP diphosphatase
MSRRELQVVAGIVERDGLILVAQRPAGDARAGRWEFPGGKLEPGETAEDCLARELAEELAIEVHAPAWLLSVTHDYPDLRVHLHAYRCRWRAGEPVAREHACVRWVAPAALAELDWSDADRPIAARLLQARRG